MPNSYDLLCAACDSDWTSGGRLSWRPPSCQCVQCCTASGRRWQ